MKQNKNPNPQDFGAIGNVVPPNERDICGIAGFGDTVIFTDEEDSTNQTLRVFDFSDPLNPTEIVAYPVQATLDGPERVWAGDNGEFAVNFAHNSDSVEIFDLSDLQNISSNVFTPSNLGMTGSMIDGKIIDENKVYVITVNGAGDTWYYGEFDISDPANVSRNFSFDLNLFGDNSGDGRFSVDTLKNGKYIIIGGAGALSVYDTDTSTFLNPGYAPFSYSDQNNLVTNAGTEDTIYMIANPFDDKFTRLYRFKLNEGEGATLRMTDYADLPPGYSFDADWGWKETDDGRLFFPFNESVMCTTAKPLMGRSMIIDTTTENGEHYGSHFTGTHFITGADQFEVYEV